MDISNAEYAIEFLDNNYYLKIDNENLLTPNNNLVAHKYYSENYNDLVLLSKVK